MPLKAAGLRSDPPVSEPEQIGAMPQASATPDPPDDPAAEANRKAWEGLEAFTKPFRCAFSDRDPVTAGADRGLKAKVPGAADQPHTTIEGGGHFLQEDRGEQLAQVVADFIATT